ncbi:hypothetical protein D915_008560 [Fasciola hepatica]|uniref:Uncharacterized protein n=1 Tax=Fasciola hepatica TaxID=6192 RepID=A0A4E0R139_FASHE|nr:hypothetical protein D915_008560 [Fasciola hepatica]
MFETATVYSLLVLLISTKLFCRFVRWFLVLPRLIVGAIVNLVIQYSVALMSVSALWSVFFGKKRSSSDKIKLGIAILTRFPITEKAIVGQTDQLDKLQASLRNATLFERILGEITASTVLRWLEQIPDGLISLRLKAQLLVVYRMNYTSAFSLSGWFSILPNHLLTRSTHAVLPAQVQTNALSSKHRVSSDILSTAVYNSNSCISVEDPDVYCSSRRLFGNSVRGLCRLSTYHRTKPCDLETALITHTPDGISVPVEYITVKGLEFSGLLEVAVRAALRSECDYVIVLNPRAIGLEPHHLSIAVQLLTGQSSSLHSESVDGSPVMQHSSSVDVVLGLTETGLRRHSISGFSSSSDSVHGSISSSSFSSPNGLYLLGLRAGRGLMLGAHQLTSSVEWATSTTGTRLWANLSRWFTDWNVVFMRTRLKEITQPPDLLALEQHLGIKIDHLLEDSITVIIPMGPGHEDDAIDLDEDVELVDIQTSKALSVTLELAVCNASGKRHIEILIISSSPDSSSASHWASVPHTIDPLSSNVRFGTSRFRSTSLRSMIQVSVHYVNGSVCTAPDCPSSNSGSTPSSVSFSEPPRRGELIRYAVDHLAKGSILVFVEPGVQLPINWDSAVHHSLQRPGVGMGCFAYRLHLQDKYIHRKSFIWALNCWLANFVVNVQTRRTEIPIVGQPHFIYAHYLACLGGYPTSSRMLHPIDLARLCQRHVGRVIVTRTPTASAGVPADFAMRHGAYRTAIYTVLLALARIFGATERELQRVLFSDGHSMHNLRRNARHRHRLPLVQPHYLDGY